MGDARPGVIYRVALENFVTYSSVELYPEKHLNLIIGPNGTGKSTFLCAIVLGLSGKTAVLGRAKKIGEYVRSGCREASIEIELFRGRGNSTMTITRSFNTDNASAWSIDRKPAKEKQVQDVVAALNIRVDNLCQLLPQDRVQDFAKMNARELLRSTMLAIGGQEAIAQLDELVELRVEHRNAAAKLGASGQRLQENEQQNVRLEAVLETMKEEKKLQAELDICNKKIVWLEYELLKNEVNTLLSDREDATKQLKVLQDRMKPTERIVAKLEEQNKKVEAEKKKNSVLTQSTKIKINKLLQASESFNSKIDEIENDWNSKIEQQTNKRREIEHAKLTLLKIQNDRDNLIKSDGDESSLTARLATIHKPIQSINAKLNDLNDSKTNAQYDIDSRIAPQIRLCRNKLNELGNADNKRMEILKTFSEHAFQAVIWLRDNKGIFRHNVYEPMILELNFADAKYAKYLENTVARRDLLAFTFEDSGDMNTFLQRVRAQGLRMVNAVCSPRSAQNFQPPFNIKELKSLGFFSYLRELVSGPEPIINFLCQQYGIHKIPIGNDKTYSVSQNVPPQITFFYSENHRFTTRVSAYSGAKSTSTSQVIPAKLLAITIDQDAIKKINDQLEGLSARQQEKTNEINRLVKEISQYEDKLNSSIAERQKLHESLEKVKTILSRIRMQQNVIKNMENQPAFNIEAEKKKMEAEVYECVKNQCRLQEQIRQALVQLHADYVESDVMAFKIKSIYETILEKNSELTGIRGEIVQKEHIVEMVNKRLGDAKRIAKSKLLEAKSLTGEYLPHDRLFPYAKQFAKLPLEMSALQEHMGMIQAKIQCMDSGDEGAVEEYKKRQKQIKLLQEEMKGLEKQSKDSEARMAVLREKWLLPLQSQIEKINKKFADMFAQLGCAGEVRLLNDGAEDDYDKYGIGILVRFRDEEKLQQLTQHVQSGGERALSTALYLLAMQQLSKAPFRCVDEINQGMDAINERKMFQLLVNVMTECDEASQYFLLTPKLLYDLEYPPTVRVHTIMNGPMAVQHFKWNFKKIVEKRRKQE